MIQAKSPLTIKVILEWTAGKGKKQPQSHFHILNRSIIPGYGPSFLINILFYLSNRRSNNEKGQERGVPICSNSSEESKTIYKTVDFAKTNALNRTKRDIESEREQAISEHTINTTNIFSNLTGGGVVAAVGANLLNR